MRCRFDAVSASLCISTHSLALPISPIPVAATARQASPTRRLHDSKGATRPGTAAKRFERPYRASSDTFRYETFAPRYRLTMGSNPAISGATRINPEIAAGTKPSRFLALHRRYGRPSPPYRAMVTARLVGDKGVPPPTHSGLRSSVRHNYRKV